MQHSNFQVAQHDNFCSDSRPVAMITGGAQRIGKSIANELHSRGVDIVIHCNRSATEAQQLATAFNHQRKHSAMVIQLDLSSPTASEKLVSETISEFGRLDFLINNASIFYPKSIFERDYEHSLQQFAMVNFQTPIKLLKQALPHLSERCGAVLNLIDIYAQSGLANHTAYVASKSALQQATKQLAVEFAPNVRVNGISPGAILWPEGPGFEKANKDEQAKQRVILENTALKRKGKQQDISATAAFLLLDASYITGLTVAVDGGRQLYI